MTTDDQPISKWRTAGQQRPGPPDQTASDIRSQVTWPFLKDVAKQVGLSAPSSAKTTVSITAR